MVSSKDHSLESNDEDVETQSLLDEAKADHEEEIKESLRSPSTKSKPSAKPPISSTNGGGLANLVILWITVLFSYVLVTTKIDLDYWSKADLAPTITLDLITTPANHEMILTDKNSAKKIFRQCLQDITPDGFMMEGKGCWDLSLYNNRTIPAPIIPLDAFKNKWFHFSGESVTRSAFYAFYSLLTNDYSIEETKLPRAKNIYIKDTDTRLTMHWAPFLSDVLEDLKTVGRAPDLIFASAGLHDLAYTSSESLYYSIGNFSHGLKDLLERRIVANITYQTSPPVNREKMQPQHFNISSYNNLEIQSMNAALASRLSKLTPAVVLVDGYWRLPVSDNNDDGIHSKSHAAASAARFGWTTLWQHYGFKSGLLTNEPAIDIPNSVEGTSVLDAAHFTSGQKFVLTLSILIFVVWQPLALLKVYGKNSNNFEKVLQKGFGFMLAVLVAMFADYQNIFPSVPKMYSRAAYYVLLGLITAVAATSRRLVDKNLLDQQLSLVLNREQTEEWKGWLQIAFILYHYMDGHESYVYYPVRVYVACYVWLTGYGNFMFFSLKNDFSFKRIAKMICRINLLISMALIALPEIDYMRYYICPLHTIFFLMVWTVMRVGKNSDASFVKKKLGLTFIILFMLHEVCPKEILKLFWFPISPFLLTIRKGSTEPTMDEWFFRFKLDGYATWLGMVVAFYICQLKSGEVSIKFTKQTQRVGIAIAISAVMLWAVISFNQSRSEFVSVHRFTSALPILAFVYLRNCTKSLRQSYLPYLSWVGRHSLEIYILQCQLFMNHNGSAHLSWVPSYPLLSLVINAAIVMYFASLANDGTLELNNFLIPSREKSATKILKTRIIPTAGFLLLAFVLSNL